MGCQKDEILIQEAEMCDKKLSPSTKKMTEEQAIKVFTCLMQESQKVKQ